METTTTMTTPEALPHDDTNEPVTRILARQLARPLTDEEIDLVAGGLMLRGDTNCETGCTCDCGT